MAARNLPFLRLISKACVLFSVLLSCSSAARAANNCPWLNEATAAGILDGDSTGEYVPAAQGKPASCTFTQTASGQTHQLVIVVEIAASPHDRMVTLMRTCGSQSEPMAAIGNEAVRCAVMAHGKSHGELLIGRVRDQVFTIAITTTAKQDPILDSHELAMRSQTAAEQISGNLF